MIPLFIKGVRGDLKQGRQAFLTKSSVVIIDRYWGCHQVRRNCLSKKS